MKKRTVYNLREENLSRKGEAISELSMNPESVFRKIFFARIKSDSSIREAPSRRAELDGGTREFVGCSRRDRITAFLAGKNSPWRDELSNLRSALIAEMEKVKISFRISCQCKVSGERGRKDDIASVNVRSLLIHRYYFAGKFAEGEKEDEEASKRDRYASSSHGRIREDSLLLLKLSRASLRQEEEG